MVLHAHICLGFWTVVDGSFDITDLEDQSGGGGKDMKESTMEIF